MILTWLTMETTLTDFINFLIFDHGVGIIASALVGLAVAIFYIVTTP